MNKDLGIAILVLSDRCARGEAADGSGPALVDWLTDQGYPGVPVTIMPDDQAGIEAQLRSWCDDHQFDVVLTCGGTGISTRDVTPEATLAVIDRELPGFGEAMRAVSRKKSAHAIISRATAGLKGGTLVINLPGSPRAAVENLAAVWSAVPHCVAKAQGDDEPCATP